MLQELKKLLVKSFRIFSSGLVDELQEQLLEAKSIDNKFEENK